MLILLHSLSESPTHILEGRGGIKPQPLKSWGKALRAYGPEIWINPVLENTAYHSPHQDLGNSYPTSNNHHRQKHLSLPLRLKIQIWMHFMDTDPQGHHQNLSFLNRWTQAHAGSRWMRGVKITGDTEKSLNIWRVKIKMKCATHPRYFWHRWTMLHSTTSPKLGSALEVQFYWACSHAAWNIWTHIQARLIYVVNYGVLLYIQSVLLNQVVHTFNLST